MKKRFGVALALTLATSAFGTVGAQDMSEHLKELVSLSRALALSDKPDFAKRADVLAAYKKNFAQDFSQQALKKYTDDELAALFAANSQTGFIALEPRFARNMEKLLWELHSRKKSKSDQFEELYRSFIRVRDFESANKMVADQLVTPMSTLPLFKPSPLVRDDVPSEWSISKTERVAELRAVDLSKDWQVIVVSHPLCHFSRRAMLEIYADKELLQRLKNRAKWIAPQDGNFEFDLTQKWNRDFPELEISVVHLRLSWPIPNFSETPVFYFLANGKVVNSFSGWPKEGNMTKLIAGLNSVSKF